MAISRRLGDFTTEGRRLAILTALAAGIGILGGVIAWILLRLIGLITHIAYDGRVGWSLIAPDPNHWGLLSLVVPVVGGLVVGLLAKYGTDKIRGHGIPEAIQAILENDSKMDARVALMKPIASAITIGTGGPFGAEGPIIMTGGAVGSLIAQFFTLSSLERRTLLVAGAAAGMSATFGSPVAAVLLAVELLLFEWRPRSLIPVSVASAVAALVRIGLLGTQPIFLTAVTTHLPSTGLIWAALIGLAAGLISGLLTKFVYLMEDIYHRLPIHWAWWPAIGGFFIGVGGLIDPRALGVGYPTIRLLDAGHIVWMAAVVLLVVKAVIWVVSLSSGTSGGVLAPLLLLGGAMGTVMAPLFPGHMVGVWATLGMAAMLGGTMRAPFTATIFTMETTHNWALLLPVLIASTAAMAVTVLWIPRSILTEKVARRGVHVAREYAVHPLEAQAVREIMTQKESIHAFPSGVTLASVADYVTHAAGIYETRFPVLDQHGKVLGMVGVREVTGCNTYTLVGEAARPVGHIGEWERVRAAIEAMARGGCEDLVVVNRQGDWVGWVTQRDVLKTWRGQLQSEELRTRVFGWRRRKSRHEVPEESPEPSV